MFTHQKVKSILLFVVALALFAVEPALAFDMSYEGGNSDFFVSGSVDLKKAGQIVTIKVEDSDSNILLVRQTETDINGEWEFSFALDSTGNITVSVSENGILDEPQTIYRSSMDDVTNALAAANGDGGISDAVNTYAPTLQINVEEYASFSSSELLNAFVDAQKPHSSVSDVKTAYNLGKFLVTVQRSTTADAILEFENSHPEVTESTQSSASDVYEGYDNSEKLLVLSKLCNKTFNDMALYAKARDEAVVINEINKAAYDSEKYGIVKKYNTSVLGLDLSKYASLGEKFESFKQTLFGMSNTDVATLKINAEAVYTTLAGGSSGGSGATGNGGKGGSGKGGGGKGTTIIVGDEALSSTDIPLLPQFSDMDNYEWAKIAVHTLAAQQVINGKSVGIFAPADNVTRAEFVKMLVGAFGLSGNAEIKFSDLPVGHWAYDFVKTAVDSKLVSGYSEEFFGTNDKITRQDMATICGRLMNVLNIAAEGEEVSFVDENEISEYAKNSVKQLAKVGVITGVGENKFAPRKNATRAEAAVVIYKLKEYSNRGEQYGKK